MVVYHVLRSSSRERRILLPPNLVGHPMQISADGNRRVFFKTPCFFLICLIFRRGYSTSSIISTLGDGGAGTGADVDYRWGRPNSRADGSSNRAGGCCCGVGGGADAGRKLLKSLFKWSSCFSVKPLAMSSDIELAILMKTSGLAKGLSYRCWATVDCGARGCWMIFRPLLPFIKKDWLISIV